MLLIDTNIWLEQLLDQERASEVEDFFNRIPSNRMYITDFSYHSIGVITTRLKKPDVLGIFTRDVLLESGVTLIRLSPREMLAIPDLCRKHGLDFDDAYQYLAAEVFGLELVSFDRDFDRTDIVRREPGAVR
jgi:predicted nucleic acid-binding protein